MKIRIDRFRGLSGVKSCGGLRIAVVLGLVGGAVACGGEDPNACVTPPASDCATAYPATFTNIHARTIVRSCTLAGTACHAPEGAQGGMVLSELDGAYRALVDGGRVIPGDPACSLLSIRVESSDPARVMPPGAPLRAGERCAIATWIRAGAPR